MKSSVEKLNDTRAKITVEVPFEELSSEFDRAYKAIAQQVQIPGFRRGKAPHQLIDARFGRGPVIEQVVNDMLPSRYGQAVEEHKLVTLGQPSIDITKIEDGEVVEFVAEVDIRPEITVPDFGAMSVEVAPRNISDDAVDDALTKLRQRFSTLKSVDRAVEEGDFVTFDAVVSVDGSEVEDAGGTGLTYEVGKDEAFDGLKDALTGLKADESATFTSTIKAGEHEGDDADITVTVHSIKVRELPEADDEFAQEASEFDTIEELRDSLKSEVEENAKATQAAEIRDEVLKAALEQAEFPLPQGLVDAQVKAQHDQVLAQVGGNEDMLDSLLQAQGTSRDQYDADARSSVEIAVRNELFLDRVAEEFEPSVSQQELYDHIMFTAQRYGMEPSQFLAQIQNNNQLGALFAEVRRGKALAEAICKVTVTDTNGEAVDPAEFFGDDEDAPAEGGAEASETAGAGESDNDTETPDEN